MTVEDREHVDALILKGGGVKGLAFAGALRELQRFYKFRSFVGVSAGGIAAVLLGAGFDSDEIEQALWSADFNEFKDRPAIAGIWRLMTRGGLHSGDRLRNWVHELLSTKISRIDRLPLRSLPTRTILYAAGPDRGTITFDSEGENRDVDADFAVRCSLAIPVFFTPQELNGGRVYDGGLLNNLPIQIYVQQHPGCSFIALYLGSNKPPLPRRRFLLLEILDIWMNRDERQTVTTNAARVVSIDPSPVRTTDFDLSGDEKKFLIAQGRAAALEFLCRARPSLQAEYERARAEADAARQSSEVKAYKRRRAARARVGIVVALCSVASLLWINSGQPPFRPSMSPSAVVEACDQLNRRAFSQPFSVRFVVTDDATRILGSITAVRTWIQSNRNKVNSQAPQVVKILDSMHTELESMENSIERMMPDITNVPLDHDPASRYSNRRERLVQAIRPVDEARARYNKLSEVFSQIVHCLPPKDSATGPR